LAVKAGGTDPESNPALRRCIQRQLRDNGYERENRKS
jgi:transcriptional/translational regulatory protein YebC/TACO1